MAFVTVARAGDVSDGEMRAFDVKGDSIAVVNAGGSFHAFGDTCTHLQCSLAEGEFEGTVVTCSCHGSQFDVTSGNVLRGPARDPVPSYPVRLEDDLIQVEV